jgi:hypothetical protein
MALLKRNQICKMRCRFVKPATYAALVSLRFIVTFAKQMRKATDSFVMSVLLSAWNSATPTRQVFVIFLIWVFIKIC